MGVGLPALQSTPDGLVLRGQERADVFAKPRRDGDRKVAFARHVKIAPGHVVADFGAAVDRHPGGSGDDFHPFGRSRAEVVRSGPDQADGLLGAVLEKNRVADDVAVEVHIGFRHDRDADKLGGKRGHDRGVMPSPADEASATWEQVRVGRAAAKGDVLRHESSPSRDSRCSPRGWCVRLADGFGRGGPARGECHGFEGAGCRRGLCSSDGVRFRKNPAAASPSRIGCGASRSGIGAAGPGVAHAGAGGLGEGGRAGQWPAPSVAFTPELVLRGAALAAPDGLAACGGGRSPLVRVPLTGRLVRA